MMPVPRTVTRMAAWLPADRPANPRRHAPAVSRRGPRVDRVAERRVEDASAALVAAPDERRAAEPDDDLRRRRALEAVVLVGLAERARQAAGDRVAHARQLARLDRPVAGEAHAAEHPDVGRP